MKDVVLDGYRMTSVDTTHEYLAAKLDLPDYYGRNLDALWDVLSTVSEPLHMVLVNGDKLISNLGSYGELLLKVLYESAEFNKKVSINVEEGKKAENEL